MANAIHGREGVLAISTSTGWSGELSTGDILANIKSWSIEPSKDNPEITHINQESKKYIEGLIGASVSFEGDWIPGQSKHRSIFNRFMLIATDSGDTDGLGETAISDDYLYGHFILKPIDSGETGADKNGAKIFCKVRSGGLGFNVDGGSPESFTFSGVADGDLTYVEGTSTDMGLPTNA